MLSKNIHRQQLAAQCNSNYPTERYNITYLYLDTGMISWLKQDFSTEHTTSTETGAWNSLASFPLQWSISFSAFHPVVCRYWWSLCTISKADEFLVLSTEKSLNHWYQHQTWPTACLPILHNSLLGRLQWRKHARTKRKKDFFPADNLLRGWVITTLNTTDLY